MVQLPLGLYRERPGDRTYLDLVEENKQLEAEVRTLRELLAARSRANWWLQVPIGVFGALAVLLTMDPSTARAGAWMGLAVQPLFMFAAARDRQWGMFFLAFFYCGVWASGLARFH